MKEKDKNEKELWIIRSETGQEPEELAPEDQLEFFHRGAEESIGSTAPRRRRRRRSRAIGPDEIPRKIPRSAPNKDDATE
jgi:hypothetical protein